MSTLAERINALRRKLAAYRDLQELGEDHQAEIQAAEAELQSLTIQTEGGAVVGGEVHTQGGDFIGRDQITYIISQGTYGGAAPKSEEEALEIYRGVMMDQCGTLPTQALSDQGSDVETVQPRLSLPGVYIQLNTDISVDPRKIKQFLEKGNLTSFSDLRPDTGKGGEGMLLERGEQEVLSALQAAILMRRLVLLGEPGAGKTTFVHHLAWCLAARRWDHLPDWRKQEREMVPILVTLRDFAYWLAGEKEAGGAGALWQFIVHDLKRRNLEFCAPLLERALQAGQALVLLDGLDETPPQPEARGRVLKIVDEFARIRYKNSRYLLTCRVRSYDDSQWQLNNQDFPTAKLAPFNEKQIDDFIHAWHNEVAAKWNRPRDELDKLENKLKSEVKRRENLRRLAPNPLLLTVMALVHTSDGELPEARALLYERAVEILLWRWDQQKGKTQGQEARIITELRQAGRDRNDLFVRLASLAFEAHRQLRDDEDHERLTGIPENRLIDELRLLHPDKSRDWAAGVIETMKQRSGLLLERQPGVFTFPHRTFQEYLAGVHLARQPNFALQALNLLAEGDFWRIVILLAVGYLVHSNKEYLIPLTLVDNLCPPEKEDTPSAWRRAWLAGEALLELGIRRARDSEYGARLLKRTQSRLQELVENGRLTPPERLEAADALGWLGDPRFDKKRLHLPALLRGAPEPNLGFVHIPAGTFTLGSEKDDPDAYRDEKPAHPVTLPAYYIARYPATNAQYAHFIAAEGYQQEKYWTPAGWAWRNGADYDLTAIEDEDLLQRYREWLARRPLERRAAPYWWNDPQWGAPTRPVVGVCWYEAMAYCAWLDERLRALKPELFPQNYVVRLPSEAEWEKAARAPLANSPASRRQPATKNRMYAWGSEWQEDCANIDETNLKQTSPAGIFPKGRTPGSDLFDLTGNVWEWTHSRWGRGLLRLEYPYPWKPDDGREDPSGAFVRVVRGGSWINNRRNARCAYRLRNVPDYFVINVGFRCVVSLAFSEF